MIPPLSRIRRRGVPGALLPKIDGICYGGDYNPEQWPEAVWREDVHLMRKAGVNMVTIGVFSWAKLQPKEGSYTFEWLDRLMDLLAENGIRADLATGTASPPPWMSRYPDLCAVNADGLPYAHGSRQHYSPSSPTYRRFAAALVRKLAARYGGHPALAAWHINNEYACHVAECHGPDSTRAFRAWLKRRYLTLDGVNTAWNTAFWSQCYSSWEEILTPRRTPTFSNPSQVLDFRRFSSDALLDLCGMERDILRKATPHLPVTTNFMGFFKPLDYWAWARELDFTCWDSYPDPLPGKHPFHEAALGHDLTRSLKPGRPFILMEHVTSHVHWRPVNASKAPGMIRLHGLQAVARGADGVLFFQWRQSAAGAEKFHGSMVPLGAPPEVSRVYREVCELGAELKKLKPVAGSLLRARVAVMMDWQTWWALELPGKPAEFGYAGLLAQVHRYFYERNVAVNFVEPGGDLTGYALVIAPTLYLLEKRNAERIDRYVRDGGALLVTCFSGIVNEQEHIVPGGYPAWLRETLGVWVEEWFPLGPEETLAVKLRGRAKPLAGRHWSEVIHLEGAGVLARFGEGHLKGSPALTRNARGKGHAFYLGTRLDNGDLDVILDQLCRDNGISPLLGAPAGVEITLRERGRRRFLFLLNHHDKPARIPLRGFTGRDLVSGKPASKAWSLPGAGAAVIELAPDAPR